MQPTLAPDFAKMDGLLPAIVQDVRTGKVLMLGYMDEAALRHTQQTGHVTFFSRSKGRLWTKGETTGHFLVLQDIRLDCDADALLIKAIPQGPTCHTGADTCWNEENPQRPSAEFLYQLEATIRHRRDHPVAGSHTSEMFAKGLNRIIQKFGEEAVEVTIEAKDDTPDRLASETADLLYRLVTLLVAKEMPLEKVLAVLQERHR